MKNFFFDENLMFEVHVVGYEKEGESIVLFLKADNKIVFSGMVDCYEQSTINKSVEILENAGRTHLDFVCLTHPHMDHIKGFQNVLENYCDKDTIFYIPPFHSIKKHEYSQGAQGLYNELFEMIKNPQKIIG